jgi:hypothetical protein
MESITPARVMERVEAAMVRGAERAQQGGG